MPKKFGTNTKAAEARAKKDEKKQIEQLKHEKKLEDEMWQDDDKHLSKKLQRKDEKEQKRIEQLERKKELAQLHDEEMASLKTKSSSLQGSQQQKVTQAEIRALREQQATEAAAAKRKEMKDPSNDPLLIENTNRMEVDGDEARTIEDAIKALSCGDAGPSERHPERRLKAAFKAFEERRLPQLRIENPGMKLSQVKQMLFKEFQSSPENPKNQDSLSYNTKR